MNVIKRELFRDVIFKIGLVGFIIALAGSSTSAVWPLYIKSFLKNDTFVGFFSSLLTFSYVIMYFILTPLLEKYHKVKLFSIGLWGMMATWLIYYFNNNATVFFVVSFASVIFFTLNYASLGIMLRYQAGIGSIGKNEALRYALVNAGWLIGPLLGGILAERFGLNSVFLAALLCIMIVPFVFRKSAFKDHTFNKIDVNIIWNLRDYASDMERVKHYIISFGVSCWWGAVYIFVPLFILEKGLGNIWVGLFMFAISVPLVILEYPLGKKVDKIGSRTFFVIGYLVMALFCLTTFLLSNIYMILLASALVSIGAAFVEPTRESYYFKIVKRSENERYYGPYQTSAYTGNALGAFTGSIILLIFSFKGIFLYFAILLAAFALFSLTLKKNK